MTSSHGLPRLKWVLALTTVFMVVEAVGGWVSGSLALLADAGHMLTDVGALSLSVVTAWVAQRPADDSKTYGYLRWEILAALVNGAALFGIATWVVIEAIQRIQHPQPVRTDLFLLVASAGLVVNLVSLWVLHASRHGSLNVRGAYLHVLGDALGSVGAVGAAAIIALTGWTIADPIVSILLSLLILVGGGGLRDSTDILLVGPPPRVHGRSSAPDAGRAGVRGARSPRLDRHQRDGRHDRARRRARPRRPSRRAGGHPDRDVTPGDRPRHHPARSGARLRGVRRRP